MLRVELEAVSIADLRAMAETAGLATRRKADIIAALAEDYREGPPVMLDPAPLNDWMLRPTQTPAALDGEDTIWPDVPIGTSSVNGGYITPPWYAELEAAAAMGHVELMGPAGSGKTLAVHHLAATQGRKLAVITADGGLRKRDLVGQRELIGGRTLYLASEFAAAARDGHMALIDEVSMAEADALGALMGMTDRPGVEGSTFSLAGKAIPVHPEFRCFLTRNPGYQGTKLMNEALRDRFWSIEVPPLLDDSLGEMLEAHGVNKKYQPYAKLLIKALHDAWEKNRIAYQISPRRALQAAQMADHTKEPFEDVLARSILTKIDQKHERDAVKVLIDNSRTAYRMMGKAKAEPTVADELEAKFPGTTKNKEADNV
jgi:nitric oxide reductase NorQ protein